MFICNGRRATICWNVDDLQWSIWACFVCMCVHYTHTLTRRVNKIKVGT